MEEEVVMQANDTHYGLAATIWTNDLKGLTEWHISWRQESFGSILGSYAI